MAARRQTAKIAPAVQENNGAVYLSGNVHTDDSLTLRGEVKLLGKDSQVYAIEFERDRYNRNNSNPHGVKCLFRLADKMMYEERGHTLDAKVDRDCGVREGIDDALHALAKKMLCYAKGVDSKEVGNGIFTVLRKYS